MRQSVANYVTGLNSRNFTNNTQRVLYALLKGASANEGWVSAKSIRVPSAGSRVRDLRLERFGSFDIQCDTAMRLGRATAGRSFLYRLVTKNLTVTQLRSVFES